MSFLKFIRIALISALIISLGAVITLLATDTTYLIKGIRATYLRGVKSAEIDDHQFFDTRVVENKEAQALYVSKQYNKKPLSDSLKNVLESTQTVGFVVLKHDSLVQEHYWSGFNDKSHTNTFSASKTLVTLLTQKAIEQGYLKSWNQKVNELIPELKGPYASELSLAHLSTMSSGINWDEHYSSPFTITAKSYYTSHLEKVILGLEVVEKPGERYLYQSGSTQLLAICVMRASGKSLSEYLSEAFWQPMGAEQAALWHTDAPNGMEIAYCCFNSNARDFARFGLLALHKGHWRGQQLLDSAFFDMASSPQLSDYYGYSYWIDEKSHGTPVFYMRGREGQYVIVVPEKNLVICRLGYRYLPEGHPHKSCFHAYVGEILKMYP